MSKSKATRFLSEYKNLLKSIAIFFFFFFFFALGYDIVSDNSNLLVNCGATKHVITDKSKFINFDQNFEARNHFVEFADGSRANIYAITKSS